VNTEALPGEVWIVDFGLAAKERPVLILAFPKQKDARSLVVVVPLTPQLRGQRGEVDIGKPRWLPKPSAVNVQGFACIDRFTAEIGKAPDRKIQCG
jgi:mRNA interferase MazF